MPFTLFASSAPSWSAVRVTTWLSRALAVLLMLSGAAAVLGWAAGVPELAAPIDGWRPMSPGSGLTSTLLGLALGLRIQGRRSASLWIAALALSLTLPAVLGIGSAWPLPQTSRVSGLLLATGSAGLLSGLLHARPDLEKLVLSLTGIGLFALAGTVAFASTLGIIGTERTGALPGASLQLLLTMGLLGLCFVLLVWWSGFREFEPPNWLPVVAGVIGLAIVVVFWREVTERERVQRAEATRQAAIAEQRLLQREVLTVASSLLRLAESAAGGTIPPREERDYLSLMRDVPSIEALFHFDARANAIAQAPVAADPEPVGLLWRRYAEAQPAPSDSLVFVALDSSHHRFAAFIPVCTAQCEGAIIAIIRSSELFGTSLRDTLTPYRFAVAGPAGPIEGSSAPAAPLPDGADSARPIRAGGVRWQLSTWPTVAQGSGLPAAILFLGLTVTLLVPLALQLGRSAWLGARERERAQLSFALDRATDGVWEVHLPSGEAVRSSALWKNLRHPPEALPGDVSGWTDLIHPEDRPTVARAMARHLAGEAESYEAEYRFQAGDGGWHTLVERGRVVEHNPLGEPSRIVGISADVTAARAADDARQDSERRFRAVFNSGFQFQVLLDCDCRVLEANQVALDHAGAEPGRVLGQHCWDTLWWAGQPAAQQRLREACAAAAGGAAVAWEEDLIRAGRPNAILEISVRPIRGNQGTSSQLLLEGRDVTERRRAEASLKEVDTLTAMGRIAARVAHEINNPLAGIQNAFLLIRDAVPPDHPHHSYVGAIEREIARISGVTRQLYETYRPEAEPSGTASLQLVVTDAIAFLQQVNRSRDVRIVTDLGGVPGAVPVPAAILRQIVYNLVQNAIEASPTGGVVSIDATVTGGALRLAVRDQGPGIAEDLREQVFEPFFSTKSKSVKTSGMGLGLALLRQTVHASGGTITLGTAPGGGAEFVVTLPLDGFHPEKIR